MIPLTNRLHIILYVPKDLLDNTRGLMFSIGDRSELDLRPDGDMAYVSAIFRQAHALQAAGNVGPG